MRSMPIQKRRSASVELRVTDPVVDERGEQRLSRSPKYTG
jgi:hypothetical protein